MSVTVTMTSLRDVSDRARFGCKGSGAESWLRQLGLDVPMPPNSWSCGGDEVLVARLATSEFLVESLADGARIREMSERLLDPGERTTGLVPVLRQDKVLELKGVRANDLLVETCNVDFRPLACDAKASSGSLVLTSMIGVGVTVVPRLAGGEVSYTIWCDPSFGHYFEATLARVASELGDGTVR
jgi:sarcosine oxidase gamma subunit